MFELGLEFDELDYFERCRGTWDCLVRTKGHGGNRPSWCRTMHASGHCERCDRRSVPTSPAPASRDMNALHIHVLGQKDYTCDEA